MSRNELAPARRKLHKLLREVEAELEAHLGTGRAAKEWSSSCPICCELNGKQEILQRAIKVLGGRT